MFVDWLENNTTTIVVWVGALCTFAIYSVLYAENRFYRFFEHIFVGLGTGISVYIVWSEVLRPKWWTPMITGEWYLAFAAVLGAMFYFVYSRKHVWISRIIFGLLMGLAAGGMFREFYALTFPQIGRSMNPIAGQPLNIWTILSAIVFYVILFSAMSYFFFSFEHKNVAVKKTAALGRWFLMIGFGAIFGATVMGRMTLFIGRLNFLAGRWFPEVGRAWGSLWFQIVVVAILAALIFFIARAIIRPRKLTKVD